MSAGTPVDRAYTIIDSHCHAWRSWPYSPLVPDEDSRGTIDQLIYEMDANGVSQALVVCAAIENNPDNVDYVSFARERHPGRLHVVADLDCVWSTTYHVAGSADRLRSLTARYSLAGFAHYLADANDGWLLSDEADAVFAVAAEHGLLVSLGATTDWHADLRVLASRHPSVPVLCQTLGGVKAAEGVDSPGLAEVVASAEVPSVYLKLAGLHYTSDLGWNYPWPDAVAVLARLYEAYGSERICWGSDFPAATRFCTYRQSLEVVRRHCPFVSQEDLPLVLGETLQRVLAECHAVR